MLCCLKQSIYVFAVRGTLLLDCAHGICRPTSARKERTETRNLQKNIQNIEKIGHLCCLWREKCKIIVLYNYFNRKRKI
jgi:hypothetical protein